MADAPLVFVSYARSDSEPVQAIVRELEARGIRIWIDTANLLPGDTWAETIETALRQTKIIIAFLSPASVRSRFVITEIEHAIGMYIDVLPVILRRIDLDLLPTRIRSINALDLSSLTNIDVAARAAEQIERYINSLSGKVVPKIINDQQQYGLAQAFAAQSRGPSKAEVSHDNNPPDSVFIVHGHDDVFLREVETFVRRLLIKPIVMKDVGGAVTSLIQKFFEIGGSAKFAIVLLSGDDYGAARIQYEAEDVGSRALQYRARQNVILELGFFYGLLGFENVFVLESAPPRVFPNFERPSDLNGVLFDRYNSTGAWRSELSKRLASHGFQVASDVDLHHVSK